MTLRYVILRLHFLFDIDVVVVVKSAVSLVVLLAFLSSLWSRVVEPGKCLMITPNTHKEKGCFSLSKRRLHLDLYLEVIHYNHVWAKQESPRIASSNQKLAVTTSKKESQQRVRPIVAPQ
jgi:hypothetical protein